jgi:hypothetical protein
VDSLSVRQLRHDGAAVVGGGEGRFGGGTSGTAAAARRGSSGSSGSSGTAAAASDGRQNSHWQLSLWY